MAQEQSPQSPRTSRLLLNWDLHSLGAAGTDMFGDDELELSDGGSPLTSPMDIDMDPFRLDVPMPDPHSHPPPSGFSVQSLLPLEVSSLL
jgi:hypothetical protein